MTVATADQVETPFWQQSPPSLYFAFLAGAVGTHLVLVELIKRRFYQSAAV